MSKNPIRIPPLHLMKSPQLCLTTCTGVFFFILINEKGHVYRSSWTKDERFCPFISSLDKKREWIKCIDSRHP